MRLPAQPPSSSPSSSTPAANPPVPRRPEGTSVAAPMKQQGLRITAVSAIIAVAGVGGIAANRHYNGNTEWINLGWTAVFAFGALGLAGVTAQFIFKGLGRINSLANFAFILVMILASAAAVLYKGPAHNFAMTQLSTCWPTGAALLAKTDPAGPQATQTASKSGSGNKAVKGEPQVKVYHKGESAHAPE